MFLSFLTRFASFSALNFISSWLFIFSAYFDSPQILRYHVIDEIHVSCSIKTNLVYPLVSLLGQEVRVRRQGDNLLAEEAMLIEPDIMATNGVLHVIDSVLIPT